MSESLHYRLGFELMCSDFMRLCLAVCFVCLPGESPAFGQVASDEAVDSSAGELRTNVIYANRGDRQLRLDIALPGDDRELRPAVLLIHGGGWRGGNRAVYHNRMRELAADGYVAMTIDYRLSGAATWPAQIEDVRTAFEWVLEHAAELKVDPERIGVMGGSAGGHLSLMFAMMPKETDSLVRPRAVFNYFGPTEFRDVEKIKHARAMVEGLIGSRLEDSAKKLAAISPVAYADRTDPPVLTFQGTNDTLVRPEQAEILHAALTKAQVPNHLHMMQGAGHGVGGDVRQVARKMSSFADAYLRGSKMPLIAREDFDSGLQRWKPTDPQAWRTSEKPGRSFISLTKKKSDYQPPVRSPHNILLLKETVVSDFVLDVDARSTNEVYGHQDLCLFFGYQDPSHFYYVHLGRKADAHANSIFLVNDAPRVSIAQKRTDGTDWSRGWHRIRIRRDVKSGLIEVFFDDMQKPVMSTVDKTFVSGCIGVGSFDDTGDFDAIRLWGKQP